MLTKPGCYNFYTKAQKAQKAEKIPLPRRKIKLFRVLCLPDEESCRVIDSDNAGVVLKF